MAKTLSVIVPAFNEGQRIGKFLPELILFKKAAPFPVELIVVNDGSTDNTMDVIQKFKSSIKIVSIQKNQGKGAAIMAGITKSNGTIVAFMDADGSTPASQLLLLAFALEKFDLVCGARNLPNSNVKARRPFAKRIISRLFNFYTELLFEIDCPDVLCGFKGMKAGLAKKLAQEMKCPGWIFDVELLARAKAMNAKTTSIPIEWNYVHGSKMKVNIETATAVFSMLKLRQMFHNQGILK